MLVADKERERKAKETIQSFLQKSIVPKIRLGHWSAPIPSLIGKWRHWNDLKSVAEKFWNKEGWRIEPETKKKPFLNKVNEIFTDIVLTQALKPYHGSVAVSFGRFLAAAFETEKPTRDQPETKANQPSVLACFCSSLHLTWLLNKKVF